NRKSASGEPEPASLDEELKMEPKTVWPPPYTVAKRRRCTSPPILKECAPLFQVRLSDAWNVFSMFRFGPPEPRGVNESLPLVSPEGEKTLFGNFWTGNGYIAIPFLLAKSIPSEMPAISKLPLWRVYPALASLTTLGEKTWVSSTIEVMELLMLLVPPPIKPAKLPGFTLVWRPLEYRPN